MKISLNGAGNFPVFIWNQNCHNMCYFKLTPEWYGLSILYKNVHKQSSIPQDKVMAFS